MMVSNRNIIMCTFMTDIIINWLLPSLITFPFSITVNAYISKLETQICKRLLTYLSSLKWMYVTVVFSLKPIDYRIYWIVAVLYNLYIVTVFKSLVPYIPFQVMIFNYYYFSRIVIVECMAMHCNEILGC